MDHMGQLHRARSEFERRLAEVRTGHLALPTPCSEWTVRQLLAHVIGGDYAYIDLLHVTQRSTGQRPGCPRQDCGHWAQFSESRLNMIIVSDPSADATRPFRTGRYTAARRRSSTARSDTPRYTGARPISVHTEDAPAGIPVPSQVSGIRFTPPRRRACTLVRASGGL